MIFFGRMFDLKVYEGTEPVFTETNHGILLKDNAFTMRF